MSDNERDRSRDRERSRRDRPSRFSDTSRDRSADRGTRDRGGGGDRNSGNSGMKSSNCRVYVSNIPYEYRWQDLKDLFRDNVGEVTFVELFVDENDKPRGCGIVEFPDPASVQKCLDVMHRFELKGRKIVIKEDFGNARDKHGNLVGKGRRMDREDRDRRDDRRSGGNNSGGGGGGGGGGPNMNSFDALSSMMGGGVGSNMGGVGGGGDHKWGNTYGLSPQFLESLNITTPLSTRVFVANLDYTVDKRKLKEVFRMAGKVQSVDLSTGKDGQSRGFAVVEFDHPVECVQAISMFNNQQLFDRNLTVRMDRGQDRDRLPEGLKTVGMGLGSNGEPLKDVARNLPNTNTPQQQANTVSASGPGILGAVPNLQLGAALNNLNSVNSALSNLGTTSALLQSTNLSGLSNSLLASDQLALAANLVNQSPLVQNQSLAALANQSAGGGGVPTFTRPDTNNYLAQNNSFNQNINQNNAAALSRVVGNLGQNFMEQQQKNAGGAPSSGSNFFGGVDRDNRSANVVVGAPANNNNMYSSTNNGSQMLRGVPPANVGPVAKPQQQNFSSKIIISNLPPLASYKMLSDKCHEFGEVQRVEDKGNGSVVVSFASEWDAERAIKNMDRARIDGRTIDVRFF